MSKYLVTCKIGFKRILETRYPPNPSINELYNYMIDNDRYKILVEEIADGQMLYDKIDTKNAAYISMSTSIWRNYISFSIGICCISTFNN